MAPCPVIFILVAENPRAEFGCGIHEFALANAKHPFRSQRAGHGRESIRAEDGLPNDHFPVAVLLESHATGFVDIAQLVRLRPKGDNVVRPAAMIASACIGDENDLGLAVAVEVLARMSSVEDYAEASRTEHYTTAAAVD